MKTLLTLIIAVLLSCNLYSQDTTETKKSVVTVDTSLPDYRNYTTSDLKLPKPKRKKRRYLHIEFITITPIYTIPPYRRNYTIKLH
jgi:hypothetical protein